MLKMAGFCDNFGRDSIFEIKAEDDMLSISELSTSRSDKEIEETSTDIQANMKQITGGMSSTTVAPLTLAERQMAKSHQKDPCSTTIPESTRIVNNWASNIWKTWAAWKNRETSTSNGRYPTVPASVELVGSSDELDYWLSQFVLEIKRADGADYPPASLFQICCALQRNLRMYSTVLHSIDIFNWQDQTFYKFRTNLFGRMQELLRTGGNTKKKRYHAIYESDEDVMWNEGIFSLDTGVGLSQAVYFYNAAIFGVLGGKRHRELMAKQFEITQEHGHEVLIFRDTDSYARRTGDRCGNKQPPKLMKHFANKGNPRCVVNLYKKYLSLVGRDGPFYLRPTIGTKGPQFSHSPIGINNLKDYMKKMYQLANINIDDRRPTEEEELSNGHHVVPLDERWDRAQGVTEKQYGDQTEYRIKPWSKLLSPSAFFNQSKAPPYSQQKRKISNNDRPPQDPSPVSEKKRQMSGTSDLENGDQGFDINSIIDHVRKTGGGKVTLTKHDQTITIEV